MNKTPLSYALGIVGAEYLTGLVPIGTHDWNKFISPQEITTVLKKVNYSYSSKKQGII